MPYECVEEFELCGVPISAGQKMGINILARHLDPKEWEEPLKFIPERFDPESKFYLTPNGNKRDATSFVPFSQGLRNCPGQIFFIKLLF